MNREQLSERIKAKSRDLGFSSCAISKATFLENEAKQLEEWLKRKAHGDMQWMDRHFDLRCDPRKLVPGAVSVISLLFNYAPQNDRLSKGLAKLARYAYGKDYHKLLRKRLKTLIGEIKLMAGTIQARCFVDSGPVLEKAWAARAGLGWIGKNGMLINRQMGSYLFIGEIITDLPLAFDQPAQSMCGTCTACIDACPTRAISAEHGVDGSKCISYFTIEKRGKLPEPYRRQFNHWVFGCDICQEVCPWQRFAMPHSEPKLNPPDALKDRADSWWKDLRQQDFERFFAGSAVRRAGHDGLLRNILFANNEKGS